MGIMKKVVLLLVLLGMGAVWAWPKEKEKVVVAYVTSWKEVMPDPMLMTHINYAFGHVTETFDGVRVDNPERLKAIVALKKQNPRLKVLLSIGGWGSGRFSEMAADKTTRRSFAKDCKRVVKEFGLDGIDIDWEYPTSNAAGISCSEDDTTNFTLLMRDIRKEIGKRKLLTMATAANGKYIDMKACMKWVDLVNMMTYDMANPPYHHSALYESAISPNNCVDKAVEVHLAAGVPKDKLVVGMPFYGRGGRENEVLRNYTRTGVLTDEFQLCWSEEAQVPYIADKDGVLVMGFDDCRSLGIKCEYIKEKGLRGGMYWSYEDEGDDHARAKAMRALLP